MKKTMLFFFVAAMLTVTSTNAISLGVSVTTEQDDKVKIKNEELPEAVKTSLQSEDYNGWVISVAYYSKSVDQYEVELKKDAETKTVKFDKDGKEVQ